MTNEFSSLNLQPQLVQAVSDLGFETPTPIQSAVIPLMLAGQDVIGQAQTGTGKTAAFGLPILNNLIPDQNHVQSLILAPTRELAIQVAQAMTDYGRYANVRVLAVYGGQPYGFQKSHLRRGIEVVVGTPGRLLDLIRQKSLHLSQVSSVVLDEADEMLSMGFIEDIETILDEMPEQHQTALFSATMPKPIRRLAKKYLTDPETVAIERAQMTVAAIEQRFYVVNHNDKMAALTRLFEVEDNTSTLIFSRTRVSTGELANELSVRGFPTEALNGDLSQNAREQVLNRFRSNQITVLVATDVAARGLDIDDISHVINFDLPQDPEIYVHRIGRTGRAGKTGIAISIITPKELYRLRKIESYTRQKMTRTAVPSIEEIQAKRETELKERMLVWLRRGRAKREREIITSMIDEGYDPIDVASAAMKLARAEEKQRPIAPISEVHEGSYSGSDQRSTRQRGRKRSNQSKGQSRSHSGSQSNGGNGRFRKDRPQEKGMVRLTMNAGKAQGVRPGDVVGTIAYHADIPGRVLGAIQIREQHTFVDVPEQYVPKVLDQRGSYQIHRQSVSIEVA